MHAARLALSVAAIASLTAVPVTASGPKGPSPQSHGPKTTSAPKTTAAPTTTTTTTAAKTHGNPHKTSTTPTTSSTGTTPPTGTTPSTGTTTPPTTSPSTTTRLNPIAAKIASKPQLSSRLKAMLPAGMTLNQASKGFKNQGQFIAALHVSRNLGIPFADLKTAMTGIRPVTTGTPGGTTTGGTSTGGTTVSTSDNTKLLSLGQAIQKLRPGTDADAAVDRAEHQTTVDVRVTSGSTTTTASATSTTTSTPTSTKRRGDK